MPSNVQECPDSQTLVDFLLGKLPMATLEDCRQHLVNCDPCVTTIRGLKVDGDTIHDLSRKAWLASIRESDQEGDVIANLMHRMEGLTEIERTGQMKPPKLNEDRAIEVTQLLGPATGEQDLGRLGKYRVRELLGVGSTGVVYRATDEDLDRTVALKVLRPSLGKLAKERFIAEARATAKLHHPNVVQIYEVGIEGPLAYISMMWEPGQTLEQLLESKENLAIEDVQALGVKLAGALDHAHHRGLVHRDIKPANVWIPEDPGVTACKILDFGLVRITDEDPQLTCTGMIAGTPCYMSPEQSRGQQLDGRSDLFSLGCVLYQALTGQLPFRSDNALSTLQSIQLDHPTALNELDPSIPVDLSDLVMCLLEKSPQRRPPNAESVGIALLSPRRKWPFAVSLSAPAPKSKAELPTFSGVWKYAATLLVGLGLGVLALIYGPHITSIVTNHGTIEIDSLVDDVKIEVMQNGERISVIDLATRQSIYIKAGNYEIRPLGDRNSIQIQNNVLTLKRGEKEIVTITRLEVAGKEAGSPVDSSLATQEPREQSGLSAVQDTGFGAAEETPDVLAAGDVLGVFIDGVLGGFETSPPVHIPPPGSNLQPSMGFPIVIESDGVVSLPLVKPISVSGKSVSEAKKLIVSAYVDGSVPILNKDARILVSLMRKRGAGSADPNHHVDTGDTLGVFVEGVLGDFEGVPPVYMPAEGSGMFPSMGYPIVVDEDGEISIPLIEPVSIRGKTIPEVKQAVVSAFTDGDPPILNKEGRILISLMRKRTKLNSSVENPLDSRPFKADSKKAGMGQGIGQGMTDRTSANSNEFDLEPGVAEELKNLERKFAEQSELFKHARISESELWKTESELLESKITSTSFMTPEVIDMMKRLLEIRKHQYELVQFELVQPRRPGEHVGPTHSELFDARIQSRSNLKKIRKQLRESETSYGFPASLPVYNGKTYEEWLTIARTERDLSKLLLALQGIANLAEDVDKTESLEVISQAIRRENPLASVPDINAFQLFKRAYIGSLSMPQRSELICREIATGNQTSVKTLNAVLNLVSIKGNLSDPEMPNVLVFKVTDAVFVRCTNEGSAEMRRALLNFLSRFAKQVKCDKEDLEKLKVIIENEYREAIASNGFYESFPFLVAKVAPEADEFFERVKLELEQCKWERYEELIVIVGALPDEQAKQLFGLVVDVWKQYDPKEFPFIKTVEYFLRFPEECVSLIPELEKSILGFQKRESEEYLLYQKLIEKAKFIREKKEH